MDLVYIIGGSGFIGKNMVRRFYDQYKILVVDKYIDTFFFSLYPDVTTLQIDLAVDMIPDSYTTPDFIINLASIVTAERDLNLFDSLISSNLKILLNLYTRFIGQADLKLFVQFGSSEEYGSEGSPFTENMREQPNSPYALVKQLTTNTTLMLQRNFGFPAMVVRPGNLFGPLQHPSKFVPYIIEKLRRNETLNVTPCEQKRDFIFVDDFATQIRLILDNYATFVGEIVNVSSGESIALKSLIEHCKQKTNSSSIVRYGKLSYRTNEVMDLNCSVTKLEKLTNTKIELKIFERLNELITK